MHLLRGDKETGSALAREWVHLLSVGLGNCEAPSGDWLCPQYGSHQSGLMLLWPLHWTRYPIKQWPQRTRDYCMCVTGCKMLGQKSVITVTMKKKTQQLHLLRTATPFAADSSHVAHWIPKFFLVVAWLGKLLKAEAAHFRVESATQNWDIVSIGYRAWKKVHSLWSSWKEELHSTVDPSQVDSTARLATSPDSFSSPWGNKILWVAHPTEAVCAAVLSWSC